MKLQMFTFSLVITCTSIARNIVNHYLLTKFRAIEKNISSKTVIIFTLFNYFQPYLIA